MPSRSITHRQEECGVKGKCTTAYSKLSVLYCWPQLSSRQNNIAMVSNLATQCDVKVFIRDELTFDIASHSSTSCLLRGRGMGKEV